MHQRGLRVAGGDFRGAVVQMLDKHAVNATPQGSPPLAVGGWRRGRGGRRGRASPARVAQRVDIAVLLAAPQAGILGNNEMPCC